MTSSACASSGGGTVRSSIFAVFAMTALCQLRRADAIQELLDLVPEVSAHIREFLCGFQHQTRCRSGFAGIFCNALDVISDIESAAGGGQDPFRDTLGSSALLLDRGGNRCSD